MPLSKKCKLNRPSEGPGDAGADEPVAVDKSTLAVPAPAVIAARHTFATSPNSLASSVAANHPTTHRLRHLQPRGSQGERRVRGAALSNPSSIGAPRRQ